LGINTSLTTTNSNITFANTLNGNKDLALAAGTGDILFTGAVGGGTRLGAITINTARTSPNPQASPPHP